MALSLSQKDALTTGPTFLGRVRQAIRQHASYLIALGAGATDAQKGWVTQIFFPGLHSAQLAANLAPQLICDATFTNASMVGADDCDVTDTALQGAVDTICEGYSL